MKYHPMLFNGEMVNAIQNNRKTQTRRVIKDRPLGILNSKIVPKKAGDIHWSYHWDLEKRMWDRHEMVIQQNCFCFEGEIERYIDPCDTFAKGKAPFPYQSTPTLCPYGQIGDRLYVRETFWQWGYWHPNTNPNAGKTKIGKTKWRFVPVNPPPNGIRFEKPSEQVYKKGQNRTIPAWHKRPSIFMPREASRLTLEITAICVERLQDMKLEDYEAEGMSGEINQAINHFISAWDSIYGNWDQNPWVWAITFKKIED